MFESYTKKIRVFQESGGVEVHLKPFECQALYRKNGESSFQRFMPNKERGVFNANDIKILIEESLPLGLTLHSSYVINFYFSSFQFKFCIMYWEQEFCSGNSTLNMKCRIKLKYVSMSVDRKI
jgi:hypothetical protein